MKILTTILLTILLLAGGQGGQESMANSPSMKMPCEASGPVTTIGSVSLCQGTTKADIPVTVTSFNNVGSMSLKLAYDPAKLGIPALLSLNPSLWPNVVVNTSIEGIITVSGYGSGLSLEDNSILLTLRFTASTSLADGIISFIENAQGTSCEYTLDVPPVYSKFCDTPTEEYYHSGGLTINPPSFTGIPPTVADLAATGSPGAIIKWYAEATGGTALAPTMVLENGHHYYASQTVNGCESSSRLDVTALVDPTPCPPAAPSPQSGITVADLTATGQNIKWYNASTGGIALEPSAPLANGTYWASQTIDCTESSSRFAVTVTIE